MPTVDSLMDEFAAALQFSDGIGRNWYALGEALCYLDEWLPGDAYILVVTEPLQALALEPGERRWLLKVLAEAGEWWAKPILDNDRFNRPARPFHAVLQCPSPELGEVLGSWPDVGELQAQVPIGVG